MKKIILLLPYFILLTNITNLQSLARATKSPYYRKPQLKPVTPISAESVQRLKTLVPGIEEQAPKGIRSLIEQKLRVAQPEFNDLILLLDPEKSEYIKKQDDILETAPPITSTLSMALQEKTAPIIVSTSIVRNVCLLHTNEKLQKIAKNMWSQFSHIKTKLDYSSFDASIISYRIGLINLSDWYCYLSNDTNLILFIPKLYIQNRIGESLLKSCGFNKESCKEITTVSFEALLKLTDLQQEVQKDIVDSIKSLFITSQSGPWNIYLLGHGRLGILDQKFLVSGLNLKEFEKLLKFLNTTIKTSFLYYSTCFSSGRFQFYINNILSKIKVNFIVATSGINETTSLGALMRKTLNKIKHFKDPANITIFASFFGLLHNRFGYKQTFAMNKKQKDRFTQNPLATIADTVSDRSSLTFIRIPKIGLFEAHTIDKNVKMITNNSYLEKEIAFDNNITTIVVFPPYVRPLIKINSNPSIVSIKPQKETNHIIHIFEEIEWKNKLSFSNIVSSFLRKNPSFTPITFIIKKLITPDGIFNNCLIHIKSLSSIILTNLAFIFLMESESGNTTLSYALKIKDENLDTFLKEFKSGEYKIQFSPRDFQQTTFENRNALFKELLPDSKRTEAASLQELIELFEQKAIEQMLPQLTEEQLKQRMATE